MAGLAPKKEKKLRNQSVCRAKRFVVMSDICRLGPDPFDWGFGARIFPTC